MFVTGRHANAGFHSSNKAIHWLSGACAAICRQAQASIAEQPCNRDSVRFRKLRFDLICAAKEIEPPLTKPLHPVGQRSGREDKSHDPG